DPRRTATCNDSDLHLPLRLGSDVALFNGLFAHLAESEALDRRFIAEHTLGFDAAVAAARASAPSIPAVAELTGLDPARIEGLYALFTQTARVVTFYSQGVNQSSAGTDKVNAIINCHLATGRIGRPGMGPFSLTGQPNAMGGREVGGLANQLAAHMEIDDPAHRDRVQRFWRSPAMAGKAGLKAVEMFEAIGEGRIKAVWIMATNPLVSLPDSERARAALAKCPLVVVSDCVAATDTTRLAHVLLPATGWGEKSGTVTNSERRISRQRDFLAPPGAARHDWRIVCDVARRMGFDGFNYGSAAEIFREHAALSGFENGGARAFDISALAGLSDAAYADLAAVQWPVTTDAPYGTARLFGAGRFLTRDGKARLLPVAPRAPINATGADYPLQLNTGRVRDQWHTMTRTGKSARLNAHVFEPYAQMHPDDARRLGLADGALARLQSGWGGMVARVRLSPAMRPGAVFAPMHWSDQFAGAGRVNALVNPAVDPLSGQPESKHTPIRVAPYAARWHAFALSRRRPIATGEGYWVEGQGEGYWRQELAGDEPPADWQAWARQRLGADDPDCEWIAFHDAAAGRYRFAWVRNRRLEGCLFVAPDHRLPSRTWLAGLFASDELAPEARLSLLAGAPRDPSADQGAIVCSCFGVGRKTIETAIAGGANNVEAIGARVRAGTNCGSCKPELGQILASARPAAFAI
ncbi:MAG: molybdopterin-dependent oxidoreductase, partial [Pseudomonadota bacterium]|nr:molybdopterin-dependent oxidoreductase [Pseudomonadota bacterium]